MMLQDNFFASIYEGKTPLFYTCKQDNTDAVEYLILKGAKVNKGTNPLISVISNENWVIAKILISNGIDINTKDEDGILFKFYIFL